MLGWVLRDMLELSSGESGNKLVVAWRTELREGRWVLCTCSQAADWMQITLSFTFFLSSEKSSGGICMVDFFPFREHRVDHLKHGWS